MNPTQRDYFDALALVRPLLGAVEVVRLATQVTVVYEPTELFTFVARPTLRGRTVESVGARTVLWRVDSRFTALPYRVERLEIMLSLLTYSVRHIYCLDSEEFSRLGLALGTDNSLLPGPRERWRRLWQRRMPGEYPLEPADDRPVCQVCRNRRVSSGHKRPDRHDNCSDFVNLVLLPALKIQRDRLKSKEAPHA